MSIAVHIRQPTILPGEAVSGNVRVATASPLKLTAIRMVVHGREVAYKSTTRREHGKQRSHTYTDDFIHFEQRLTFFGHMRTSGRKGGATLQPGTYNYAFTVAIPPSAPPSLDFGGDDYGCNISYTIRAYIDIPFAPDVETVRLFRVLPTVPVAQLVAAQNAVIHGKSQCVVSDGCAALCSSVPSGMVDAEYSVSNRMPLLTRTTQQAAPQGLPPPPPVSIAREGPPGQFDIVDFPPRLNIVRLKCTVTNRTKDDCVRVVDVKLKQFMQVTVRGHKASTNRTLGMRQFRGEVRPGQQKSMIFDFPILNDTSYGVSGFKKGFLDKIFGDSPPASESFPPPGIRTKFFDTSCTMKLYCPSKSIEAVLVRSGIFMASAVDHSNRVPSMPATYTTSHIIPERMWQPPPPAPADVMMAAAPLPDVCMGTVV